MIIFRSPGRVYLISAGNGYFKIGSSNNPRGRLQQLQAASPIDLHLLAEVHSVDALGLETRLHERFKEFRRRGEWFQLSTSDVENFVSTAEREDRLREADAEAQVEEEARRLARADREAVLRSVAGLLDRLGKGDVGKTEAALDHDGTGQLSGAFEFRGQVRYKVRQRDGFKDVRVEVHFLRHSG